MSFGVKATVHARQLRTAKLYITKPSFDTPWACSGAADTSILQCNLLLNSTEDYDLANDIPEQRNALIEFYNSTGGQYWGSVSDGASLRSTVDIFKTYLIQIGQLAAQATFAVEYLPADTQKIYYAVAQLSVGCQLQRTIQLVELLIKYKWNTASKRCCPRALCVGAVLHLLTCSLISLGRCSHQSANAQQSEQQSACSQTHSTA